MPLRFVPLLSEFLQFLRFKRKVITICSIWFFFVKIRGRVDEAEAILLNINRVNGKEKEPEDLKSRLEYVSKSMREEKVYSHKSLLFLLLLKSSSGNIN